MAQHLLVDRPDFELQSNGILPFAAFSHGHRATLMANACIGKEA
jgi:hypothetical protein